MLDSVVNDIIGYHKSGDWLNVLQLHQISNSNCLLWPKPNVDDLKFISENIKALGGSDLTSIGSGTGLLEWLLQSVTGLEVISVEIDKLYWTTKISRYKFTKLIFPDDNNFKIYVTSPKYALMFCYFNNGKAFAQYLQEYKGNILVIIGPTVTGKYSDPMPYDPNIPNDWELYNERKLAEGDVITIYVKKKN